VCSKISVVVEGYNESLNLGSADAVIDALREQRHVTCEVELLLCGSSAQCAAWRSRPGFADGFARVEAIPCDGLHYYALKNRGAREATGDVIAFIDTDTLPHEDWLSTIAAAFAAGGEATAGLTLFRADDHRRPVHPDVLLAAACVSWGFVPSTGAFLSHNLAIRADLFRELTYREDLGRTLAGHFLKTALDERGSRIELNPRQQVAHAWSLRWWLTRLHPRFGHETYLLRRADAGLAHPWVGRLRFAEPLATAGWRIVHDVPASLRFTSLLGLPLGRRLRLVPVVLGLSVLARSAEVVGAWATMVAPGRMQRFAARN
jgi:glycosyltransferase involved in cell wall biosynthesis